MVCVAFACVCEAAEIPKGVGYTRDNVVPETDEILQEKPGASEEKMFKKMQPIDGGKGDGARKRNPKNPERRFRMQKMNLLWEKAKKVGLKLSNSHSHNSFKLIIYMSTQTL